ncbi:MAG: putative selenium-dependent hydroxylase accessory protein YqeC [Desulfobacter sp.]|nr:putative selenium-dependent hydroxylase accessory protein YqeC [Desulfobacter sp.]WDP83871.1 MAG: putative selenium-dependent hydroxylase accessory protein YqeC [Desulfobacter sp.]
MTLYNALNLNLPQVISVVGAGGKTSFIFTLAKAAASQNASVLVTTTTAMFNPGMFETDCPSCKRSQPFDRLFIGSGSDLLAQAAEPGKILVAGADQKQKGKKLAGYSSPDLAPLAAARSFDLVLIEGDGARMRPIKAPAPHEPVILESTDMVVGCIGLDCINRPLDDPFVHRPERLAELSGQSVGEKITEHTLFSLVRSRFGLFKSTSKNMKKILVLNKADTVESQDQAVAMGKQIVKGDMVNTCLMTCLSDSDDPLKHRIPDQ